MYNEDKERAIEGIYAAYEKANVLHKRNSREVSPEVKRVKAMRETKAREWDINDYDASMTRRW